MGEQRHSIRRQVLELRVRDQAQAVALQAELGRIWRARLLPVIQRCCDELGGPGRLYRIERLELDLGSLDPDRLESELVAKVGAALRRGLAGALGEPGAPEVTRDQAPQSQLELLTLFARQGSLPWWADPARPRLLEEGLDQVLRQAPGRLRLALAHWAREGRPLERLIRHLDDRRIAALAALCAPGLGEAPADLFQSLMAARAEAPAGEFRVTLWQCILGVLAPGGGSQADPAALRRSVLARLAPRGRSAPGALAQAVGEGAAGSALPGVDPRAAPTAGASSRQGGDPDSDGVSARAPAPPPARLPDADRQARPEWDERPAPAPLGSRSACWVAAGAAAAGAPPASPAPDPGFSDADVVYIDNAGLVLLWPFLRRLFERLDLLAGEGFRDGAAAMRGVALLHYLAAEETDPPDYLLPLAKVLCGLEPAAVFVPGPPLSPAQTDECALLLRALVAQAPILGAMSNAGLRGNFLLRRGILGERDGAWLVQVERETQDIVLERLPWGLDWIRLPWMAAPLRVQW